MTTLTAAEFKILVNKDPAWAAKLTEPVEISDYADLSSSKITHLSPFLHFQGTDGIQNAAAFERCQHLKVAEGNFNGYVSFEQSHIEAIGALVIRRANYLGDAASFDYCKNLKVAEGTFPGRVTFSRSRIQKIGDLKFTCASRNTEIARFIQCNQLKVAEGTFPGYVDFHKSAIETIGDLRVTQATTQGKLAGFTNCRHLKPLTSKWIGPEIEMDPELRTRSIAQIEIDAKIKRLLKNQPDIDI